MPSYSVADASSHAQKSSHINTIAHGSLYAFIGLVVGALLQYAYNLGLARLFGASLTGLFVFGFSVINITVMIGLLGSQELLLRFVSAYQVTARTNLLKGVVGFGFLLGLVGTLTGASALWIGAPTIARLANNAQYTLVLRSLSFAVPALALILSASAVLQGMKRLDHSIFVKEIGVSLIIVTTLVLSWILHLPFKTFLSVYILLMPLLAILSLFLVRVDVTALHTFRGIELRSREWLAFSLPVTLMSFFQSATGWSDTFLIGLFRPTEEVGVYFAALRTALLLTIVLTALNAIFAPLAADLWEKKELWQLEQAYKTTTRWTCTLTFPVAVVIALTRDELMSLFGKDFQIGSMVLLIILIGRVVNSATGGVSRLLVMTGHQKLELVNSFLAMGSMIAGMLWAIPRYGIIGAAVVNSFVIGAMNLLKLLQVYKAIGIQPYDASYFKIIVATALAFLAGSYVHNLSTAYSSILVLLVMSTTVSLVYILSLVAIGLPDEDTELLYTVIHRVTK